MSLPRETVMELMALADGELDGEAKVHAESMVTKSAEARRFMDALASVEMGTFLEGDLERRASQAGVEAIAETVITRIRTASSRAEAPPAAPLESTLRPLRPRPRLRVATACVAVALAAGVALYIGRRPHADDAIPIARVDLAPPGPGGVAAAPAEGVELNEIDSPVHDISVFEISGSVAAAAANPARPSSVVIWIEDGTGPK